MNNNITNSTSHAIPRSSVECLGMDASRCGYCCSANSSRNFGVWAHRLSVHDYQNLLDAGWRRSGCYLYRPDVSTTCCPTFVIRLEASRFAPTSTHKRVLKRLRRISRHDLNNPPVSDSPAPPSSASSSSATFVNVTEPSNDHSPRNTILQLICDTVADSHGKNVIASMLDEKQMREFSKHIKIFPPRCKRPNENEPKISWTSNAAMIVAAAERKHTSTSTTTKTNMTKTAMINRQMEIATILQQDLQICFTEYNVSVTSPGFINFVAIDQSTHSIVRQTLPPLMTHEHKASKTQSGTERLHTKRHKWQHATKPPTKRLEMLHQVQVEDIISESNQHDGATQTQPHIQQQQYLRTMNELTKEGTFTMEMVPSQFRSDAYEIFKKYQMTVHHDTPDQCAREAYLRFLVDSPLSREQVSPSVDGWYGSYHILYKLEGRLFAVGVVDLLPRSLSSVYLFYDPEFAKLSPGILSALKEIEWVQRGVTWFPSMKFYYMGFYIHSCSKMRYKTSFKPSELLCDVTKHWIPSSIAQIALDAAERQRSQIAAIGNTEIQTEMLLQMSSSTRPTLGGRVRLAPEGMAPSAEATNFQFGDDELDTLTNDCKLQITIEGDDINAKDKRLVSLRTISRLLNTQCSEQLHRIRLRLRAFIQLVGRTSAKFFMHVL